MHEAMWLKVEEKDRAVLLYGGGGRNNIEFRMKPRWGEKKEESGKGFYGKCGKTEKALLVAKSRKAR